MMMVVVKSMNQIKEGNLLSWEIFQLETLVSLPPRALSVWNGKNPLPAKINVQDDNDDEGVDKKKEEHL